MCVAAASSTAPSRYSSDPQRHSRRPQRKTAQMIDASTASPIRPASAAIFTAMLCGSFCSRMPYFAPNSGVRKLNAFKPCPQIGERVNMSRPMRAKTTRDAVELSRFSAMGVW